MLVLARCLRVLTCFLSERSIVAKGDEIAVKPGREGLVYSGPYSPITDVVLIATGLGVVPMIQMVNELLPSRGSSVSTASGELLFLCRNAMQPFLHHHQRRDTFNHNHNNERAKWKTAYYYPPFPDLLLFNLASIQRPGHGEEKLKGEQRLDRATDR